MATAAQIRANRANAKKSTGPTSPEGKHICSLNAHKHGLSTHATFIFLEDEDPDAFVELHTKLCESFDPQTDAEAQIVSRMATYEWSIARAQRFIAHCLDPNMHVQAISEMHLYMRYQAENERAYSRCLKDLLSLRAERRKAEIGSVSLKLKIAANNRAERALAIRERKAGITLRPVPTCKMSKKLLPHHLIPAPEHTKKRLNPLSSHSSDEISATSVPPASDKTSQNCFSTCFNYLHPFSSGADVPSH